MKIIAVTGTAGVGKTTYAKKIAKEKKYLYFDLSEFIKQKKLYDYYDFSLRTHVVDVGEVVEIMEDVFEGFRKEGWKGVVLDGHLSHYFPKKLVDNVVVVRCDVKTLRKRLEKRKYSKKKIEENIEAEIMETCLIEARELGHKVIMLLKEKD